MAEAAAIDDAERDEARARRLRWRMLIGFLAGLVIGLSVHYGAPGAAWVETVTTYVTGPLGQIFLRLLFMLVIPLLVSALIVGVTEMGEMQRDDRSEEHTSELQSLMSSSYAVF